MSYELRDGQGILHSERDKKTAKAPDFTGRVVIDGKQYRLSAWQRTGKSGSPYLSLACELDRNTKIQPPCVEDYSQQKASRLAEHNAEKGTAFDSEVAKLGAMSAAERKRYLENLREWDEDETATALETALSKSNAPAAVSAPF
jgi:hypothetical protein